MKKYTQFIGPAYFFTTDPKEVPKKSRKAIEKKALLDFSREQVLAVCGIDQFCYGGHIWVVVSRERVIAYKNPVLHQNFFSDLTGVERSITGDIILLSPGNKSDLFHFFQMPHKKLIDRLFRIIHNQWITAREQVNSQTLSDSSDNYTSVDQLERLAKLRDQGVLNEEEFSLEKAKILSS